MFQSSRQMVLKLSTFILGERVRELIKININGIHNESIKIHVNFNNNWTLKLTFLYVIQGASEEGFYSFIGYYKIAFWTLLDNFHFNILVNYSTGN